MKQKKFSHRAFVDAENIPARYGTEVLWRLHRLRSVTWVYGSQGALDHWYPLIETNNLRTRMHDGGKQATDQLIRTDAWNAFLYERIWHLVFVTDDGDFAPDIRELCALGGQVIVMGRRASCRLQVACTSFLRLGKK
jgi:uncharacterized LabA/DUF88 family protein